MSPPGSAGTTIERAKGLLMFRHGLNSHQAFALLLDHARRLETDVAGAARRLVDEALDEGRARSRDDRLRWMAAAAEASRALYARSSSPELDRVLETAVRTADAERGLIVTLQPDRPGVLTVLASHGFPGMQSGVRLPRREPWVTVLATGTATRWTGRLDAAEVSARVDAVVVTFAPVPGGPGALLVARSAGADGGWPDADLPILLAAFAHQVSPGAAAQATAGPGR